MLVLSRKLNQSIHIGHNISVSIVRIKGNVVQLGIEAPREIHVLRSELIERDAQSAAGAGGEVSVESEVESERSTTSGQTPGVDADSGSKLLAALRVISQVETSRTNSPTLSPTMSLFTGS